MAWAAIGLAGAALAAYANSFSAPFVFDDAPAIEANATIRHLWPPAIPLHPPAAQGVTVGGRPVLNLSLALNYAVSGLDVWSYHVVNLLIHILAGLVLFGIVRRTLLGLQNPGSAAGAGATTRAGDGNRATPARRPSRLAGLSPGQATGVAFVAALLWLLHPLQTEAVTYVIQRAESLMGLFYLLTLYCFIRAAVPNTIPPTRDHETGGPAGPAIADRRPPGFRSAWPALSFLCCCLGMATKEVMVTAPLMVFVYDRTFLAGTCGEAWRRRWRVHLALGSTWGLLGALAWSTAGRGGTVGFAGSFPWWQYALTQCQAVPHYLLLALWPGRLVFDYGDHALPFSSAVLISGLLLAALLGATAVAWRRWPAAGFFGVGFFLILAPSSSIVPIVTQVAAEHRMYLPLAAVTVALVAGACAVAGPRTLWLWLAVAVGFGWLTARRNLDYRTPLSLWSDTVAKNPGSPRAHATLGYLFDQDGRLSAAIGQYRAALRLRPRFDEARINLGNALIRAGRIEEAEATFRDAVRLDPGSAVARYNLATLLARTGRWSDAAAEFQTALRLDPANAGAHNNLGNVYLKLGRPGDAAVQYRQALRLDPDLADAHNNLGGAYLQLGRIDDARRQFEDALRLRPGDATAQANLLRTQTAARAAPRP